MDRMDMYKALLEGNMTSTEAAEQVKEGFPDFLKKKKDGDDDKDDKKKDDKKKDDKKKKKKDGDDEDVEEGAMSHGVGTKTKRTRKPRVR